jgi:predicted O-methyltransferase YrrM
MAVGAEYDFDEDWFSAWIPTFETHVGRLAGAACRLLEIGAYQGRSTTWLADNALQHPDARLDSIDLWFCDKLRRNVEKTGRASQITLHEGRSRVVLRGLPLGAYDFIYVDGGHATVEVLEDAVLSFRLAKVGAVIAFDDYLWDTPPWNTCGVPKPALDAFLSMYVNPDRYPPLAEVIDTGGDWQLWVRKLGDGDP